MNAMQDVVTAEIEQPSGPIWLWSHIRQREMVQAVPGAKFDNKRQQWRVPLSWASCKTLRGVFGGYLASGENLAAWAWHEYNTRVQPCTALRELTDGPGDPALFPFQRPGAQFIATARGAILGDDMGTGKTVQAAVALRTLWETGHEPWPVLVVCPNIAKRTWQRELEKWVPGIDVQVVGGDINNRRRAIDSTTNVCIINYESTWRHSRLSGYGNIALKDSEKELGELNHVPWKVVIADEAHRIKNPLAKQTRAVWWLAHQLTVRYRWALTGTPIANAPDDLWAILHFIDNLEWPAKTEFIERYCLMAWDARGGLAVVGIKPEMREEFFSIIDHRFRRMPKYLVLPYLPPKLRKTLYAEMSAKQKKSYRQMKEEGIAWVGEEEELEAVIATNPMVKNLRLIQLASSYAEINEQDKVRLTEPSNKVDALIDIMEQQPDEYFVVFAESRQLLEIASRRLEKEGITHRMIVGGMSDAMRGRAEDDFQQGHVRAILGTIGAMSESVTLTRARYAVFLQRSWRMLGNKQAEDRVHRIGSEVHESVLIIDIVAPGTAEEKQIEKLQEKMARLDEITRDKQLLHNAATNGDLDAVAALRQLEYEEESITETDLAVEVFAA